MRRLNKELVEIFEEQVLKGTCFHSLKELQEDKTQAFANLPRAMIAVNLEGIWKGMNLINDLERNIK